MYTADNCVVATLGKQAEEQMEISGALMKKAGALPSSDPKRKTLMEEAYEADCRVTALREAQTARRQKQGRV